MEFVVDPQAFAAFLHPYCPGGSETQNGDAFYVRVDVGSTAREARGWSFEPYELSHADSMRAALDIFDRITTEPTEPQRAWAKVYRRQANKATKILELTGKAEEPAEAKLPPTMWDKAIESGDGGKLFAAFFKAQADTAQMVIKGQATQLDLMQETISDLRLALDSSVTKWEKAFTEKEDLRAKLVVMEVKMGMFIVEAVKDVLPKFAQGFNSYAESKGKAAEKEAENRAKEKADKAAEQPAGKDPEKATVDELTDGVIEALGNLLIEQPKLLTGERLDAIITILGTAVGKLGAAALQLVTRERWTVIRQGYLRLEQVAKVQGYPL